MFDLIIKVGKEKSTMPLIHSALHSSEDGKLTYISIFNLFYHKLTLIQYKQRFYLNNFKILFG